MTTNEKHAADPIVFELDPMTESCLRGLRNGLQHVHGANITRYSDEGQADQIKTRELLNTLLDKKPAKDADGDSIWQVSISRAQAAHAIPLLVLGLQGKARPGAKHDGQSFEGNTGIVHARRAMLLQHKLLHGGETSIEALAEDTRDTFIALAKEYGIDIPEKSKAKSSDNKIQDILAKGPSGPSDKDGPEGFINPESGEMLPR